MRARCDIQMISERISWRRSVTRASGPCPRRSKIKDCCFPSSHARAGGPCHNEAPRHCTIRPIPV